MVKEPAKRPWWKTAWKVCLGAAVALLALASAVTTFADLWGIVWEFMEARPAEGWLAALSLLFVSLILWGVMETRLDNERARVSEGADRLEREAKADIALVTALLGDLAPGGETRQSVENHPGEKAFRRVWTMGIQSALERWEDNVAPIHDSVLREAMGEVMEAVEEFNRSLLDYEMVTWDDNAPWIDMRLRRFPTDKEYRQFMAEQPRLRWRVRDGLRVVERRLYELRVDTGDAGVVQP